MTQAEFETVYQTYFSVVYGYLIEQCRDASLAEELTAETFFKALRNIDGFRGDCKISSWLCQIAKNAYISYLRKNDPKRHLPLENAPCEADDAQEDFLVKEAAEGALKALHSLDEPYKEVFYLRALGDYSYKSIAKLFGKSENWACVVYHRARIKIREIMEEKDEI